MSIETPPAPSTPATPAAAQVAAPPAAPTPAIPAQPQTVTIPLEQLQAFTSIQTRLAQLETEQRAKEAAAQQETAAILVKKGEVESALRLLREQSDQAIASERTQRATIEDRAKRYALDGEVSRVLASQQLVPGGAEQLTKLWRSEFTVEPQGDSFAVRTPTFQSVADFVTAQLARPEYAHFVRAQNPGGGTGAVNPAGQTAPTQAANAAAPPEIKTLSDAVIFAMKQRDGAKGDGRVNPAAGFGLRPSAKQA